MGIPTPNRMYRKYPTHRNESLKTPQLWLKGRREDDGAEGLWRIHDELYDLSSWIHEHPGGVDWIELTKGTDITEAFETHHILDSAEKLLPQFYVRKAKTTRNAKFTFHENGFYRTLKRRINEEFKTIPRHEALKSKMISDILLSLAFLSAIIATKTQHSGMIIIAALFLSWTIICAHNFIHQADNWRMYNLNLSLMTVRDFRIIHVLSHHLYTNTLADLEISVMEPWINWLPKPKPRTKYLSSVASPIVYVFIYFGSFVSRIIYDIKSKAWDEFKFQDLIPLVLPTVMYVVTDVDLYVVLKTWLWILFLSSFIFGLVGLNAAHHHPDIYHEGDTPRSNKDWGLCQLDAVMDRREINGSLFLELTNFGDHGLHHFFPSVDHELLPLFRPLTEEVCAQFGVQLRITSHLDLLFGQFRQQVKTVANPDPPALDMQNTNRF